MGRVALVGLVPSMAEVVAAALAGEGHDVVQLPLDADVLRQVTRSAPDAVVFDGHPYANTKAFLNALESRPDARPVPVVLLGPARPAEVPQFEVVYQLGRTFDLITVTIGWQADDNQIQLCLVKHGTMVSEYPCIGRIRFREALRLILVSITEGRQADLIF